MPIVRPLGGTRLEFRTAMNDLLNTGNLHGRGTRPLPRCLHLKIVYGSTRDLGPFKPFVTE